jgi:hypothetical protein
LRKIEGITRERKIEWRFWKQWDAEDGAKWERVKAKGKWRFILRTAALNTFLWVLIFSLMDYFQMKDIVGSRPPLLHFLYRYALLNLVIGLIWGIFSAVLIWVGAERNYKKLKTTK